MITESSLTELLADLLTSETDSSDCVARVTTYEEAGVFTNDAGLVVRMTDGKEFQITIKRSR